MPLIQIAQLGLVSTGRPSQPGPFDRCQHVGASCCLADHAVSALRESPQCHADLRLPIHLAVARPPPPVVRTGDAIQGEPFAQARRSRCSAGSNEDRGRLVRISAAPSRHRVQVQRQRQPHRTPRHRHAADQHAPSATASTQRLLGLRLRVSAPVLPRVSITPARLQVAPGPSRRPAGVPPSAPSCGPTADEAAGTVAAVRLPPTMITSGPRARPLGAYRRCRVASSMSSRHRPRSCSRSVSFVVSRLRGDATPVCCAPAPRQSAVGAGCVRSLAALSLARLRRRVALQALALVGLPLSTRSDRPAAA